MSRRLAPLVLLPLLLSACGSMQRLTEVGRPPRMTAPSDPTKMPGWRPLTMPMPAAQVASPAPNALWRSGSRAFFKDQRASRVGDIVTVLVNISDGAQMQNDTSASRTGKAGFGVPNMFGLEASIPTMLAGAVASKLLSTSGDTDNTGKAQIKRNEKVTLRLAGVVTQVLPNGNLVVAARQEVRVNSELRQLAVTGVIRPQDIASDNTVTSDRMAEARIAYGGRGQMTYVQTPRWGQQVIDAVAPF